MRVCLGGNNSSLYQTYFDIYFLYIFSASQLDGVNVKSYSAWSLVDGIGWTSGYSERSGLYNVDFGSPERERTPKPVAGFYRSVQFRDNVFDHNALSTTYTDLSYIHPSVL